MLPRRYIVNTGLLMEWLVVRYREEYRTKWPAKFHMQSLHSADAIAACKEFLGKHVGKLVTSAGVIAELQGHERAARGQCDRFWTLARTELELLRLREVHVPLSELDPDDLRELGPVDASLIEIARRPPKDVRGCQMVVMTADGPLVSRCRAHSLRADHPVEVFERFMENRK